jgi:hypothetical protein
MELKVSIVQSHCGNSDNATMVCCDAKIKDVKKHNSLSLVSLLAFHLGHTDDSWILKRKQVY